MGPYLACNHAIFLLVAVMSAQAELLHVIAVDRHVSGHRSTRHAMHRGEYAIDMPAEPDSHRRVRPRRE
jgi:hypothetical protein